MSRAWRLLTAAGTALAVAGAVHAALNLRHLARPMAAGGAVCDPVSVLIPARDESARIAATVASVLAQRNVPRLQVAVLDDGSTDGTARAAAGAAAGDPRLQVDISSGDPPPGWLGKPYACQRLADSATGSVLVFLDADVVLAPDAISAAVQMLGETGADFASPWPRQVASGALGRLVQPLQQWSWATTLPLRLASASARPTLAAANGQFLVIAREAYHRAGGHAAVADCVLEDIELARAAKRAGLTTALWDGSALARCRMYDSAADLRAGYRKSLWAAFGPRGAPLAVRAAAAAAAWSVLCLAYVAPAAAMLAGPDPTTRALGAAGYAAGVASRALVARRTGSPVWPDSLAHPLSVAVLLGLTVDSFVARAAGRTRWKGRDLGGGHRSRDRAAAAPYP